MAYIKCPKCGSEKCQLTAKAKHHGVLWFLLFGIIWMIYAFCKWCVGIVIAMVFDWWMAIIKAIMKKPYYWHCKKWFVKRNSYYCQECGFNFKK